jgi:hypothetical protein
MLSHGEPPLPATKRAANDPIYSSKTTQQLLDSPPRTPPSQTQQGPRNARFRPPQQRALKVRPSLRETFLDDITPTDNVRGNQDYGENLDERDPHDLSLSPRHVTRASVFDNMLLSLDQIAGAGPALIDESRNYSGPCDIDPYSARYGSMRSGRGRGHTFSSSLSSHTDTLDESLSRQSNQSSRAGWGNNNFQPGLGRIEDFNGEEFISVRGRVYEAQRALPPGEKIRSRGTRKSSKSSGSSSVDFGQMMASSHYTPNNERRSASFEYPYTHRKVQSLESTNGLAAQLSPSRSHHSRVDSLDVAPTPSVPSGPRRPQSPVYSAFPPHPTHAPPQTPNVVRKNSNKSSKGTHNRKVRPETLGTASIKGRGNDFAAIRDVTELPITPAFVQAPAPSPTISLHKSSLPSSTSTESTPQNKEQQRPGFFRRVFGSSRNTTPSNEQYHTSLSQGDPAMNTESERVLSLEEHHASAGHGKLQKPVPKDIQTNTTPSQSKENVPALNKKPSSFFRRRKKSISEHTPPPVLIPIQHTLRVVNYKNAHPSPVSSLRKVMDPYLNSLQISPPPRFFDTKENFESDHTGDEAEDFEDNGPGAIRKFQSNSDISESKSRSATHSTTLRKRDLPSPKLDTLDPKVNSHSNLSLHIAQRRPHSSRDVDDSFLADSSGNEGPSSKSSQKSDILKSMTIATPRRPKTSPTKPNYEEDMSLNDGNVNLLPGNFASVPKSSGEFSPRLKMDEPKTIKLVTSNESASSLQPDQRKENLKPNPFANSRDEPSPTSRSRAGQGWLEPASDDERLHDPSKSSSPINGVRESPKISSSDLSSYKSASSTPILTTPIMPSEDQLPHAATPVITVEQDEPTAADREHAKAVFEGREDSVSQANAAAWLGESDPQRERVRRAYMELFSWSGLNILAALRDLCAKIALKGETQQLDRILDSFSTRWCECNPNHGFKATGEP